MDETQQTQQPTTPPPPTPQPVQTTAVEPTMPASSHKMLIAGTLFLIVLLAVVGFVYMNSQKKIADSEIPVAISPAAEPTMSITIKEEEDVDAIDVGDIEDDFADVNADVNKL